MDWKKEMEVALEAAQKAGETLLDLFGRVETIRKKGKIDLVTEADLKAEQIIVDTISHSFPDDTIVTEEGGEYTHSPDRVWFVDPLDGTTNFAHAFHFFCVSIALEYCQEMVLGLILNPYTEEHFQAITGDGASLNGKPIHVSQTSTLQEALLGTGFPYYVQERPERVTKNFMKMLIRAQGLRRPGSAALDLCYVAAGVFDGFYEEGLKPWDTAAGTLIVKEAGGRVSTYEGEKFTPYSETIVVSNGHLHEQLIDVLES